MTRCLLTTFAWEWIAPLCLEPLQSCQECDSPAPLSTEAAGERNYKGCLLELFPSRQPVVCREKELGSRERRGQRRRGGCAVPRL